MIHVIDMLRTKIFLDSADLNQIIALKDKPFIKGFTTNPALIRKAGVKDYKAFAIEAASLVHPRPISFEVFADELPEMEKQARIIAGWAANAVVKIPVTNTKGVFTGPVIAALCRDKIKVNVTAVFTLEQIEAVKPILQGGYLSIFAGRIADLWLDEEFLISRALSKSYETIWASTRESKNVWQANSIGCDVITVTADIVAKLELLGKRPADFSLETIRMFYDDAQAAGFIIPEPGFGEGGFG